MTTYADIEPQATLWTWEGRIPRGEVTLIAGEGGVSKGLMLCDLAARVTTGAPMPGETEGREPGSVIMITPEDDLAETVAWRLRAAGADLSRCHDLTFLPGGAPFEMSASDRYAGNVAQLRAAVDAIGDVRMIIIDPMMACVAHGSVATNLGARRVVTPLQRLAKETGVSVVMSHHVVKSGAIAGSKGLIDALRVVYTVRRDPENQAFRVVSLTKSNVLGATEDLRYTLAGEGNETRLQWLDRDALDERRAGWRQQGAPAAPKPAPRPAAAWKAVVTTPQGTRTLVRDAADPKFAMSACAATPESLALGKAGYRLQWQQESPVTWTARAAAVTFTITADRSA